MRKPNRYDSTPSRNMPLINMRNIKTVSGIIVQNILKQSVYGGLKLTKFKVGNI